MERTRTVRSESNEQSLLISKTAIPISSQSSFFYLPERKPVGWQSPPLRLRLNLFRFFLLQLQSLLDLIILFYLARYALSLSLSLSVVRILILDPVIYLIWNLINLP